MFMFFPGQLVVFWWFIPPKKNGWKIHSGDLALRFPSAVVGTLVCLTTAVANASTRCQTGIRHTYPPALEPGEKMPGKHLSHGKNICYFPLNPGCLIGIVISWLIIIPTSLGSIIPYITLPETNIAHENPHVSL